MILGDVRAEFGLVFVAERSENGNADAALPVDEDREWDGVDAVAAVQVGLGAVLDVVDDHIGGGQRLDALTDPFARRAVRRGEGHQQPALRTDAEVPTADVGRDRSRRSRGGVRCGTASCGEGHGRCDDGDRENDEERGDQPGGGGAAGAV